MRVLGIDPGTVATGWGVIEVGPRSSHRCVASGVIRVRGELPSRLASIFTGVRAIVAEHRPQALSLEKSFVGENVQSAFRLGEARGTILVAAAEAGLAVFEYSPAEIKMSVVGYGRALKEQVQIMVTRLLCLDGTPATDEADALAAAICHLNSQRLQRMVGEVVPATRRRSRPSRAPAGLQVAAPRWRR